MDIILSIITFAFIALLIGFAITFGFALLGVLLLMGAGIAVIAVAREYLRRWRFIDSVKKSENNGPQIIEAEYKDITYKDK